MKRRTALKLASSSLITTGVGSKISQGNEDDEVGIVTDIYKGDPVNRELVPKRWHNKVKKTRKIQQRLFENYRKKDWFKSIGRKAGDDNIGDMSAPILSLRIIEGVDPNRNLPEKVDGIPVDVQEVKKEEEKKQGKITLQQVQNVGILVPV